ncbi:MAG: 23S rRNA (pseudouridine(1915)-N(3))-methyltransferase RlmH [Bacillota bacterium]
MQFTIVCVGKLKESYWKEGVAEYTKRLQRYGKINIVELPDEKAPETMSEAQKQEVLQKEGNRITKAIPENSFAVILAIEGKQLSSEKLSALVTEKEVTGISHMTFVIGGSLGVSDEVMQAGKLHLSISKMTFPHQMIRLILLEQIYRAIKIQKNEPYHK